MVDFVTFISKKSERSINNKDLQENAKLLFADVSNI